MRSKKLIGLVLTGSMLVSVTGCASSTASSQGETIVSTEATAVEESTDTKVTLHHGDDESQAASTKDEGTTADNTDKETERESETQGELPPSEQSVSEQFLGLLNMSLDEARDYYNVKEDSSLTADDFDQYLADLFEVYVTADYSTFHQYVKDAEKLGIDISDITYDLGSLVTTDEAYVEDAETLNAYVSELLAFPYDKLNNRQKLVFDKLYYENIMGIWLDSVGNLSCAVSPNGVLSNLGIDFYEFIFDSEDDVKAYAKVMDYVPGMISEIMKDVNAKIEKYGYYPSDYQIDATLDTAEELIETRNNPFIDGYNEKIDALKLDKDVAKEYKDANKSFYVDEIIPEIKKLISELKELKGKNVEGNGICDFEGGKDYYEAVFENQLGNLITPEEGFNMLVEDFEYKIAREQMLATFCYNELDKYFDGKLNYPEIQKKSAKELAELVMEQLAGEFPALGDVEFNISELPKSLSIDYVLAYYIIPRIDSSELNIIRYNKKTYGKDIFETISTIAHEGYPGHMLQFNLQKNSGLYPIEYMITHLGYIEGWAQVVMHKAYKVLGCTDYFAQFIEADTYLNYDLMGIADIAFNYLGWSRQDFQKWLRGYDLEFGGEEMDDLFLLLTADPASYVPYTLGPIVVQGILADYEEHHSMYEAYETFCEIGAAPFNIVRKYMGTKFE